MVFSHLTFNTMAYVYLYDRRLLDFLVEEHGCSVNPLNVSTILCLLHHSHSHTVPLT